jgi:enoyl-CoA hydratase/carnithine racemase
VIEDKVRLEIGAGGVGIATLTRPDRANALDDDLQLGLGRWIAEVARNVEISALVLTGEGKHFCAGADLEATGFNQATPEESEVFSRTTHEAEVALANFPVPTIAAVNGAAVGGGFGLALACDLRLAAPKAFFSAPFIRMGIAPDSGVSYFLPRIVGPSRALEIIFSCRRVEAAEALDLGIVVGVHDDVLAAALDLARTIASHPRVSVAVARSLVYRAEQNRMERQLLEDEARAQAVALHSDEYKERFAAYVAERERSGRGRARAD